MGSVFVFTRGRLHMCMEFQIPQGCMLPWLTGSIKTWLDTRITIQIQGIKGKKKKKENEEKQKMAYILGDKIFKIFKSSQWIWCTLTLKALPSLSHIFLPWLVYFPGARYAALDTSGTIWFWCILSSILPKANDLQLGMKIKFDCLKHGLEEGEHWAVHLFIQER